LDQPVAPMAVEAAGRAGSVQIAAARARTPEAVVPKGLTRERRSSAAGAGSCAPSTGHDRRQPVARQVLPRLTTRQEENSPTARQRSQELSARDAIRLHTKGTQEQGPRRSRSSATIVPLRCGVRTA